MESASQCYLCVSLAKLGPPSGEQCVGGEKHTAGHLVACAGCGNEGQPHTFACCQTTGQGTVSFALVSPRPPLPRFLFFFPSLFLLLSPAGSQVEILNGSREREGWRLMLGLSSSWTGLSGAEVGEHLLS